MFVPIAFVNQTQLSTAVTQAVQTLGREVVRLRHTIGEDTSGDPAIFFRIVLADWAVDEETLADVAGKISTTLINELRPYENWGLLPYFSFRSNSEQSGEREWA